MARGTRKRPWGDPGGGVGEEVKGDGGDPGSGFGDAAKHTGKCFDDDNGWKYLAHCCTSCNNSKLYLFVGYESQS